MELYHSFSFLSILRHSRGQTRIYMSLSKQNDRCGSVAGMQTGWNENRALLRGTAAGSPVFSHENHGVAYDLFPLSVQRRFPELENRHVDFLKRDIIKAMNKAAALDELISGHRGGRRPCLFPRG